MKRTDLVAGQDYGHTDSPIYTRATRVTVLTTDPLVRIDAPMFTRDRTPYLREVTLPDGAIIKALARPAKAGDTAARKGVLVCRPDGQVFVSSLGSLRGKWSEVVEQEARREAARAAESRDRVAAVQAAEERRHAASAALTAKLGHAVHVGPSGALWALAPDDVEALLALIP